MFLLSLSLCLCLSPSLVLCLIPRAAALTSLTELAVGRNAIEQLPNALKALTRLKTLAVRHNKLQRLPGASLAALMNLSRLFAQENEVCI